MASEPSSGTELRRKGLHLLALIIPWGMLHVQKDTAFFVLGLAGTLSLGLDLGRAYFTPVAQLVSKVGGALMRPEETSSLRGQIVINGSTWILITAFLLLLLFPANIASLALVIFLLGDAAAGLIGRNYGRISWRISNRTVEGSAAFLAVSLLAVWLWPAGIPTWIAAIAAVCACAVEILPGPFNDNLQVPLAAAGSIFILQHLPL